MRVALLTVVLVAALVATPVLAQVDVYTIDADHPLASESMVDEYERTGVVSAELLVPSVTITIAEEHEDVGIEGVRGDAPWHYVRLQYNETLPAELRLYFPAGYWHPHPQDLTALDSDVTAELRSVEDGQYSALTVRFDGRSDVVFAVPRTASLVFATRDYGREFVENRTDMEFPEIGESDPWSYIDESSLTGNNTTVAIQAQREQDLTVQYDAGDLEERWIAAPGCSDTTGKDEPVCEFERDGDPGRVYVLSRVSDPPPIRYKYDAGPGVQLRNLGDSIGLTIDRALSWFGGLLGGA